MQAFNFSKLNSREKKIYTFGDINLSKSGIDSRFLIISAILVAVSLMINGIIAALIGDVYFSPFKGSDIDVMPLMLVLGIPIGLASALFYIKLNSYRLIDFLIIYFSPKKTIDTSGKQVEVISYKYDAFLEKQYNSEFTSEYKEKKTAAKSNKKNNKKSRRR